MQAAGASGSRRRRRARRPSVAAAMVRFEVDGGGGASGGEDEVGEGAMLEPEGDASDDVEDVEIIDADADVLHSAMRAAMHEVSAEELSVLSLDDELELGRGDGRAVRAGAFSAGQVLSAIATGAPQGAARAQSGANAGGGTLGGDVFSEIIRAAAGSGTDDGDGELDAGAAATAAVAQLVSASGGQLPEGLSRLLSPYRAHFEELRALGRGGFGEVVAARGRLDGRLVAVKRVPFRSAAPPWAKRGVLETLHDDLLREARALALIDHPNVVRYHSAWIEPRWERLVETVGGAESAGPHASGLRSRSWRQPIGGAADVRGGERGGRGADGGILIRELSESPGARGDSEGLGLALASVQHDRASTVAPGAVSRVISDPVSQGSDDYDYSDSYVTDTGQADDATRDGDPSAGMDGSSLVKLVTPAAQAASVDWPYCLHIAMELCQGITLTQWLVEQGNCEQRELAPIMAIMGGIIKALDYIHSHGVVHRDIKPSNIFVLPGPSELEPQVKLGDFGLATLDPRLSAAREDAGSARQREAKFDGRGGMTRGVGTAMYSAPGKLRARAHAHSCTEVRALVFAAAVARL